MLRENGLVLHRFGFDLSLILPLRHLDRRGSRHLLHKGLSEIRLSTFLLRHLVSKKAMSLIRLCHSA